MFLDRFISVLSAAFACLATLLAAVGLYGVLAYTVAQRTREIGLRMALGAEPSRVLKMVLRQVAIMTLVGGAIGLGASIWLGNLAASLLYELKGHDIVVLVGGGDRAERRGARGGLPARAPRVQDRADARAPLRVATASSSTGRAPDRAPGASPASSLRRTRSGSWARVDRTRSEPGAVAPVPLRGSPSSP